MAGKSEKKELLNRKRLEILNDCHLGTLKEFLINTSISAAVSALMLQELLCNNNAKLGHEVLESYWERLGEINKCDMAELSDNEGEGLFVLGLLQGLSLSNGLEFYNPKQAG